MYEVILPKKLGYFGKVQEVLEDLFNEEAIRTVPFVKQSIARNRRRNAGFDEEAWIKTLSRAVAGLLDLRDGRPLPLAAGAGRRAGAGHPVHLPQPRRRRGRRPRPTSSPRRWRSSTTWSRTASPPSSGSRRRSGSSNTTIPSWRSGARATPDDADRGGRPMSRIRPRDRPLRRGRAAPGLRDLGPVPRARDRPVGPGAWSIARARRRTCSTPTSSSPTG